MSQPFKYNGPDDNSGPAFPAELTFYEGKDTLLKTQFAGMTLRQWYAGMALQGMLTFDPRAPYRNLARDAFILADEMIKAGKEKPK